MTINNQGREGTTVHSATWSIGVTRLPISECKSLFGGPESMGQLAIVASDGEVLHILPELAIYVGRGWFVIISITSIYFHVASNYQASPNVLKCSCLSYSLFQKARQIAL